jgi:hypothetical protein
MYDTVHNMYIHTMYVCTYEFHMLILLSACAWILKRAIAYLKKHFQTSRGAKRSVHKISGSMRFELKNSTVY